jgi:hypothetical protein
MSLEDLEARIQRLEDIESIKDVQRSYGYYMEHGMGDELADLFADGADTAFFLVDFGTMQGKESIKQFFDSFTRASKNHGYLHQTMQLSPIINVDTSGKTAQGRWYGFGMIVTPDRSGVRETILSLIYENDYVKEDHVWKIKVARVNQLYDYDPTARIMSKLIPDQPDSWSPSAYVMPFHFKHPVTGE